VKLLAQNRKASAESIIARTRLPSPGVGRGSPRLEVASRRTLVDWTVGSQASGAPARGGHLPARCTDATAREVTVALGKISSLLSLDVHDDHRPSTYGVFAPKLRLRHCNSPAILPDSAGFFRARTVSRVWIAIWMLFAKTVAPLSSRTDLLSGATSKVTGWSWRAPKPRY